MPTNFEIFFDCDLFLASINAIERPFHPDTGKDLGNIWRRQSDQILPTSHKLAKPNALMFFHIPLYVRSGFLLMVGIENILDRKLSQNQT